MKIEAPSRIRTLDIVKGMLIIAVVMTHMTMISSYERGDPNMLTEGLYILIMLFFVISGYVYKPERRYLRNVKNRTKQLGVRLVLGLTILPLILWPYLLMFGNVVTSDDYLRCLISLIGNDLVLQPLDASFTKLSCLNIYSGYYFLQIMIVGFIIFYAIADRLRDSLPKTVAAMVILTAMSFAMMEYIGYYLPLWFELTPFAVALMVFGSYLSNIKYVENAENTGWRGRRNWIVMAITLAGAAVMLYFLPIGTGFDYHYFGEYGYISIFPFLLTALLCGTFFLTLIAILPKIPILSDMFSFVGTFSIGILCLHIFIAKVLIAPFCPFDFPAVMPVLETWEGVLLGTATIIICIIISYILNTRLQILFGKSKDNKE